MKSSSRMNKIFSIILIILMIYATRSIIQGVRSAVGTAHGSFDFQYDSALLFRKGINPYDESLNPTGVAERLGLIEYYDRPAANQFPSLLAILVPLTSLSPYAANVFWVLINLASTAVIVLLSRKLFFEKISDKTLLVFCCCMLTGPWKTGIGLGQHTIFAFALYLIALWLSDKKKTVLSGIALSLSFFKYTLTVPLSLYFLFKRKYNELAISIGIHIVATPLCAWWLNDSVINMIRKPLMVSSNLSSDGYIDFGTILHLEPGIGMLFALLACGFMFILSLLKGERNGLLLYAILSYTSLIIVYHRIYDFFILIIPAGVFIKMWLDNRDSAGSKIRFANMTASILIYAYASFSGGIVYRIDFLTKMIPFLTTVYAIAVYAFIVFLIVQYLAGISNQRYVAEGIR